MRREQCVFYLSSARLSRLFLTLFWYQGSGCCGLGEALTDGLGSEGVVILSGQQADVQVESGDEKCCRDLTWHLEHFASDLKERTQCTLNMFASDTMLGRSSW